MQEISFQLTWHTCKISANFITFRHSNLYTHALEVVKLGDANPIAYNCAMELLRAAMDKLTPLASEHDGLGLEHRTEFKRAKVTELSLLQGPENGCMSDDEGSAVGNYIGLSAPERKRKAGRPTNAETSLHMMTGLQRAKKLRLHHNLIQLSDAVQASQHDSALYVVALVIRARRVHKEGTPLKRKGKKRNAQSAEWEGIERTPVAILRLWYMLPSNQLIILLSKHLSPAS
ncbi:hypothetical protein VPH35_076854 [Triticum aestivum]